MLAGYTGYVVADAHVVYDYLYEPAGGRLVEVNLRVPRDRDQQDRGIVIGEIAAS